MRNESQYTASGWVAGEIAPDTISRKIASRVATIGGSMAAYHAIALADGIDMDNRGVLNAANARLGCPMRITNYGVAGVQSATVVSDQLPLLTVGSFDYVAIFTGGNDLLAGTLVDTTYRNIKRMVIKALSIGATPLVFTIPPYSNSVLTDAQRSAQTQLNQLIMTLPQNYKNCFAFDLFAELVNPTSTTNAYKTNYTYDNIHTAWRGCHAASINMATWLQYTVGIAPRSLSVVSIVDTWTVCGAAHASGVNLCDPGVSFFSGTSGTTVQVSGGTNPCTVTGNVPGVSATDRVNLYCESGGVAGMDCTITTGTDTDGITYMDLAITTTASGQYIGLVIQSLVARAVDTKWYESEAYVRITGGSVRPSEVCLFTSYSADQAKRASQGFATTGTSPQGVMTDATLLLATPRKQFLTANHNALQPILRFKFVNNGTCTIRVKQIGLIAYDSQNGE